MKPFSLIFLFLFNSLLLYSNQEPFVFSIGQENRSYSIPDIKKLVYDTSTSCVQQNIHQLTIHTPSGVPVPITFFDRKSSIVLVAAQGLPASKESMHIFARLFNNFDIILFDYRWNNRYYCFLAASCLTRNPIKKIVLDETEELNTVVDFIYRTKQYTHIIGLGECYSCFHLLKVQAERRTAGKKSFTHLILDSCWHSLKNLIKRVCHDPFLPISPQHGGCPSLIRYITQNTLFKEIILKLFFAMMPNITITPYLAILDIPILFIHGSHDLFVPIKHFQKIWGATPHEYRHALYTPYWHSDNLHNKHIYRYVVENFITHTSQATLMQTTSLLSSYADGL